MSADSRGAPGKRTRTVLAIVLAGAGTCAFITGCGRDDDRIAQAPADSTPMLPGARAAGAGADAGAFSADAGEGANPDARPGEAPGAQRFDTAGGSREQGAPGALLPPVMHTAD